MKAIEYEIYLKSTISFFLVLQYGKVIQIFGINNLVSNVDVFKMKQSLR